MSVQSHTSKYKTAGRQKGERDANKAKGGANCDCIHFAVRAFVLSLKGGKEASPFRLLSVAHKHIRAHMNMHVLGALLFSPSSISTRKHAQSRQCVMEIHLLFGGNYFETFSTKHEHKQCQTAQDQC